jgi:hypothetical protein
MLDPVGQHLRCGMRAMGRQDAEQCGESEADEEMGRAHGV